MLVCKRPNLLARTGVASVATALVALSLGGCTQNPYTVAPGGVAWQGNPAPNLTVEQAQLAELNRRVKLLDDNNRQLTTQLAQSEQKSQVYRDELNLVREQLADTARQFDAAKIAAQQAQQQARSFQASTQLRGNASIQPNTNLSAQAAQLNLGGLLVEPDGEVIRITLPADQLFQQGTAQLLPQAAATLDPVAAQLRAAFPRQRLGIEAHTDNAPLYGGQATTSHQLASAQAVAVLDFLTRRSGLPAEQLFMISHGANDPREPNDSAAGRSANRRVELVVYPENF